MGLKEHHIGDTLKGMQVFKTKKTLYTHKQDK